MFLNFLSAALTRQIQNAFARHCRVGQVLVLNLASMFKNGGEVIFVQSQAAKRIRSGRKKLNCQNPSAKISETMPFYLRNRINFRAVLARKIKFYAKMEFVSKKNSVAVL